MHSLPTNFANDQEHKDSHVNSARETHLAYQAKKTMATFRVFTGEILFLAFTHTFKETWWSSTKESFSQNIGDVQAEPRIISCFLETSEPQKKDSHPSRKIVFFSDCLSNCDFWKHLDSLCSNLLQIEHCLTRQKLSYVRTCCGGNIQQKISEHFLAKQTTLHQTQS